MGSVGRSCSLSGDCYCKPNITGQLCSVPSNGYYYRLLDYDIAEAEYGSFSMVSILIIYTNNDDNDRALLDIIQ